MGPRKNGREGDARVSLARVFLAPIFFFLGPPSRAFFLAPIYFLAPATQATSHISIFTILVKTKINAVNFSQRAYQRRQLPQIFKGKIFIRSNRKKILRNSYYWYKYLQSREKKYSKINDRFLRPIHTKAKTWGAFHLGKNPGNFGGRKSGISDW